MIDETGEKQEVKEPTSSQKLPVSQKQYFSGLKQMAPDLVKKIKRFWPHHKEVLPHEESKGIASLSALQKFLARLDISVVAIDKTTTVIQEGWNCALRLYREKAFDLAKEHQGDLYHTNTLATESSSYEAGIVWSKRLGSAGFYVCSLNTANRKNKQLPALIMKEARKLDFPSQSLPLVIDLETSWTPKGLSAEMEVDMLDEFSLCVTAKKGVINSNGRLFNPQLGIQADNNEVFVDVSGEYRDCLPKIIEVLKPDYVEIYLSEADLNVWIASSGLFRKLVLKAKVRSQYNNEDPVTREYIRKNSIPDFVAEVPISWIEDFERIVGKGVLNGHSDGQTFVLAVKKRYNKMGDILDVLKNIAGIAADTMPWERFSITGKTKGMNATRFFNSQPPTKATITKFDLYERSRHSGNSITSEFHRLLSPGLIEQSVIFSAWVYPEKSILQEFQENFLRRLGIAAPEDISENVLES